MTGVASLQDQALPVLLPLGEKSSTCGSLENLTNACVCLGRTFKVFVRADLLANFFALFQECVSLDMLYGSLLIPANPAGSVRAEFF